MRTGLSTGSPQRFVLSKQLDLEICLEIVHSSAGEDFYEALREELEKLLKQTI